MISGAEAERDMPQHSRTAPTMWEMLALIPRHSFCSP